MAKIARTKMVDYMFDWDKKYAITFGDGSLLNNAGFEANVRYKLNKTDKKITFYTKKTVKKGQELTIDYGRSPSKESKNEK